MPHDMVKISIGHSSFSAPAKNISRPTYVRAVACGIR